MHRSGSDLVCKPGCEHAGADDAADAAQGVCCAAEASAFVVIRAGVRSLTQDAHEAGQGVVPVWMEAGEQVGGATDLAHAER